jgi:hypothetical protein
VCDELGPVDELWVLGDIVGYGPQPNEVIRRLQELGARAVTGNHDGAAIGTVDASWFNPDARAAIRWTTTVLDENSRAYLGAAGGAAGRRPDDIRSPREPIWEHHRRGDRGCQPAGLRDAQLPLRPHPPARHLRRRWDPHLRRPGRARPASPLMTVER